MNWRVASISLVGSLAVVTVLWLLAGAMTRDLDPRGYCDTGFSRLVSCTYHMSSRRTVQPNPAFAARFAQSSPAPSIPPATPPRETIDVTSWAMARCPQNTVAKNLLCAKAGVALVQNWRDDPVTGLPLARPWLLTTAKNSPYLLAIHVETPLDWSVARESYRVELGKRGWSETTVTIGTDDAAIAFATSSGPALLKLSRDGGLTTIDLSLRRSGELRPALVPPSGQAKLMLGNSTDKDVVITIDGQTFRLAARAGSQLDASERTSGENPAIDLSPGPYVVRIEDGTGTVRAQQFKAAANETWGLLVGPAGLAVPVHVY